MKNETILVLGIPTEAQIAMLRERCAGVHIIIGNSAEVFEKDAAPARVLFRWSGSQAVFKKVFEMCRNLLWVHSLSAGLDKVLFPELVESSVLLT
ncbi:MAG: hypothetical protein WAO11_01700, partial [Candidatus Acidiferrum sp.]